MPRTSSIAFAIAMCFACCSFADEKADWLNFFVGDWTRHEKTWSEAGGWDEEDSSWSCQLAANGKATISKGKVQQTGDEWVLVSSCDSDRFHFEHGVSAKGLVWSIDFEQADADVLRGNAAGNMNGQAWTAVVTIKKTGEDSYIATGEAKSQDGKVILKINAENKRKSANEDKKKELLARWEKDFMGQWTSTRTLEEAIEGFGEAGDEVTNVIELKRISEGLYTADAQEINGTQCGLRTHFVFGWDPVGQQIQARAFNTSGATTCLNFRFDGENWGGDSSGVTPDGRQNKAEFKITVAEKQHVWHFSNGSLDGEELPENTTTFYRQ